MGPILLDTGPLVAYLKRRDQHHEWAREQFELCTEPLVTCEPVLSEACFLLQRIEGGTAAVMDLLTCGVISIGFQIDGEVPALTKLMARYANVPMSLADACLVRMAEQYAHSAVMTTDSDFKVYRQHGRQVIPTLMPPDDQG